MSNFCSQNMYVDITVDPNADINTRKCFKCSLLIASFVVPKGYDDKLAYACILG